MSILDIGNASPSEEDEDSVEFYDAQGSDTFSLNLANSTTGNSIAQNRERTDSQGSDDGSSSEYDTTPGGLNSSYRNVPPNSNSPTNLDVSVQLFLLFIKIFFVDIIVAKNT